jgi:hypothetical protein
VWNRKRLRIVSLILELTLAVVVFTAVWWVVG